MPLSLRIRYLDSTRRGWSLGLRGVITMIVMMMMVIRRWCREGLPLSTSRDVVEGVALVLLLGNRVGVVEGRAVME